MPRLINIKRSSDSILFENVDIEERGKLYNCVEHSGVIEKLTRPPDIERWIFALGLHVQKLDEHTELPVLEDLFARVKVGQHEYGEVPGHLCSTFRYVNEKDEVDPVENPFPYTPGYVFNTPIPIRKREPFSVIVRAEVLPMPVRPLQVMLFTVQKEDVTEIEYPTMGEQK